MLNVLFLLINLFICLYFIYKKDYAIIGYIIIFQEIHLVPFKNLGYTNVGFIYYILISILFLYSISNFKISIKRIIFLLNNKIIWVIGAITFMLIFHTIVFGLPTDNSRELVFRYFTQVFPAIIYLLLVLEKADSEVFVNQITKGVLIFGFLLALILISTTDVLNIADYRRRFISEEIGVSPIAITRIGCVMLITSILIFIDQSYKKHTIIPAIVISISIGLILIGSSRGPLISMIIALLFYLAFRKKKIVLDIFKKNLFKIIISITISVIIILRYNLFELSIIDVYSDRINSLQYYEETWRYLRYQLFFEYYFNNFSFVSPIILFGAGPAGFDRILGYQYAHNFIMELTFEYGIIGLLCALVFIGTVVKYSIEILRMNISELYMIVPIIIIFRLMTHMFSGDLIDWRNLLFWSIILIHIHRYIKSSNNYKKDLGRISKIIIK